jgi:aspartate aminotransferase
MKVNYLFLFKKEIEVRLQKIYKGFMKLKQEGLMVDAIAPEGGIYLTIQINLVGKKTSAGKLLSDQSEVTAYILDEAKLAVVPFYAFGAENNSPWYRLSVGTCRLEEIEPVFKQLETALEKLK